jgi:putative transcriptional regulator
MTLPAIEAILLKTERADKHITFAVLDALCRALDCEPGDLLEYLPKGKRKAG